VSAELSKRPLSAHDLALAAARKRRSPRTGFVHLFSTDATATDTIPLYENFCFALALCREKKAETVLEAKDLVSRLLAFQGGEGNFPIYLHDYPRCFDPHSGLKIGAALCFLLREFGSVMGVELGEKMGAALRQVLHWASLKSWTPLWERRLQALAGNEGFSFLDLSSLTAEELWEETVTRSVLGQETEIPFHETLCCFMGPTVGRRQGGYEPIPFLVEWAVAPFFSTRLLADHPSQILLPLGFLARPRIAASGPWDVTVDPHPRAAHWVQVLWGHERLHSLVLPRGSGRVRVATTKTGLELEIDLDPTAEEVAFYCDSVPEHRWAVDGRQGTVFRCGQSLTLTSQELQITVQWEGSSNDFCGHIHRANRPTQTGISGASGHEAYDWKVFLRRLRAKDPGTFNIKIDFAKPYTEIMPILRNND
jgi:hypothetical protein